MRRLFRIGLSSAMALSLLIVVAAIAMRVRGRSVSDEFIGWHGTAVEGAEGREWYWTARFDNGRIDGGRDETILTFATPQDAEAAVAAAREVELPRWRSFPPLGPASGQSSLLNRLGFSANFSTVRPPGAARVAPGGRPEDPVARAGRAAAYGQYATVGGRGGGACAAVIVADLDLAPSAAPTVARAAGPVPGVRLRPPRQR